MASNPYKTTGLLGWVDNRFPLTVLWHDHMDRYYAAKNFNFWYYFGSLALVVLVNQILTGVWLAMFYKPSAAEAFASVEFNIMRDVGYGWLIRYMHSTGASFFFICVYMHMFRGLMYGSYRKPRELVWLFGALIFLALMAEAFMGYLLPWGQTSYWGANVIISLFSAIPIVGDAIVTFIQGDFYISDATLNRFFSLHVILIPLVLYFFWAVVALVGAKDYAAVQAWFGNPLNMGLSCAFVLLGFFQSAIGLQVVLEDYVHHETGKWLAIIAVKGLCLIGALVGVAAILKLGL